jgi:hypothetical protein
MNDGNDASLDQTQGEAEDTAMDATGTSMWLGRRVKKNSWFFGDEWMNYQCR